MGRQVQEWRQAKHLRISSQPGGKEEGRQGKGNHSSPVNHQQARRKRLRRRKERMAKRRWRLMRRRKKRRRRWKWMRRRRMKRKTRKKRRNLMNQSLTLSCYPTLPEL